MKQHRSIILLILPFALSLGVVSCHAPVPLRQEMVAQVPSITGQVTDLFASRSVQATTADVANGATVSLIDTATGQTVATTVTTPTGGFTLNFGSDFKPVTGKPYYMEAVKGLPVGGVPNRAGAAIARVRTILFYNWNGWSSLSGGVGFPVSIGKATTSVAAIVSLKGLSTASQSALVGTVSGLNFTDPSHTIGATDFSTVFNLIDAAVSADQDPLEALAFDSSGATPATQYVLKARNLVIHDNYSVNGTPNPATASLNAPYNTITFYGQNFPSSASVTIGTVPVATWSVNAKRTQLTATLAANGYSGGLQITQGTSTWSGPFVPVSGTVGTLAGGGYAAFAEGKGATAQFMNNGMLAVDTSGNIYVGDAENHRIRKITPAGNVVTIAGSGQAGSADGVGTDAQFNLPYGVAVDSSGNVFVADYGNNRIRKITPAGVVSTLAGSTLGYAEGSGSAAKFTNPVGIAIDSSGSLYVTEHNNVAGGSARIRKVSLTGDVTTLAGSTVGYADGVGAAAQFNHPFGITVDSAGNVYVADYSNARFRKISPNGTVTTLKDNLGNVITGGFFEPFGSPRGIAVDSAGNLFVTDYSHTINKISTGGVLSTLAGSSGVLGFADGSAANARFYYNEAIAIDQLGKIYVKDAANHRIRVFTP